MADSLTKRVTEYITQGGKPSEQGETTNQSDQYKGFYKVSDGFFTKDPTKIPEVSFDSNTGKIKVRVPDVYANDDYINKLVDDSVLSNLSANYKANKDIKYQDPNDESKQYNTQEYIDKINESLQDRVKTLKGVDDTKVDLISRYGGTPEKDKVINSMSIKDMVTMTTSATGENVNDDSLVAIPEHILLAYPEIKNLESYTDGFVKKGDFLNNFYNASEHISLGQANAIKNSIDMMLSEVEDLSTDQLARNLALKQFLSQNDPKLSWWDAVMTATGTHIDAGAKSLYDWGVSVIDNVVNFDTLTWTGLHDKIDVPGFFEGLTGVDKRFQEELKFYANTDKDAYQSALTGYQLGQYAGRAAEMAISMVAFGEITSAVTSAITQSGATKAAETAVDQSLSQASQTGVYSGMPDESLIKTPKFTGKYYNNLVNATAKSVQSNILEATGSLELVMSNLTPTQLASIANSVYKTASIASLANTGIGVLNTIVSVAMFSNRDLTEKIIHNEATAPEVKLWAQSMALDSIKWTALGALGDVATSKVLAPIGAKIGETEVAQTVKRAASKGVKTARNVVTTPFRNALQWINDKREIARQTGKAMSNAKMAQQEAIREALLADEVSRFTASQSIVRPSSAVSSPQNVLSTVFGEAQTSIQSGLSIASSLGTQSLTVGIGGLVLDPVTNTLSPYENAQALEARAENARTDWGGTGEEVQELINEISDPNQFPTESSQVKTLGDAETKLSNEEARLGLLKPEVVKTNVNLRKQGHFGAISGFHSAEVMNYGNAYQDMVVAEAKARANGIDPNKSEKYTAAKERFDNASQRLDEVTNGKAGELKLIIENEVIPAYRNLSGSLQTLLAYEYGGYPQALLEGLRNGGEWGKDGSLWTKRVTRKSVTDTFTPYNDYSHNDHITALTRDANIPESDQTWFSAGINEQLHQLAYARQNQEWLSAQTKGTGLTPEVVISGEKTAAARQLKEYKGEIKGALSLGLKEAGKDLTATEAVVSKKDTLAKKARQEESNIAGICVMEDSELKVAMKDSGVATTDDITDQKSLDKFIDGSSKKAKSLIRQDSSDPVSYDAWLRAKANNPDLETQVNKYNAIGNLEKMSKNSTVKAYSEDYLESMETIPSQETWEGITDDIEVEIPKAKGKKGEKLKYELNTEVLDEDIDDFIDGVIDVVSADNKAVLAMQGKAELAGNEMSDTLFKFYVLEELLSSRNAKELKRTIKDVAKKVVDKNIPKDKPTFTGNVNSLVNKVEKRITDRLEKRFANAKTTLESAGVNVESTTVTELLDKFNEEVIGAKQDKLVVRIGDNKGEIQYLRVSPAIANIYNNRVIYKPKSTIAALASTAGIVKKTFTTTLNPRSWTKQAASDTIMAYVTTGAIPGTLTAMRDEIAATFGQEIADTMERIEPRRFERVKQLAERENISIGEAAVRNINAQLESRLPFTTFNREVARQTSSLKYGPELGAEMVKKNALEKFNDGMNRTAEKIAKLNDKREIYTRKTAAVASYNNAINKGYNYKQAEWFARHAQDNATTNFRQKSVMFNTLRSTTPYLISGISGAKSFWKMFELDPVGVSARIFSGIICPLMFFFGEVMDDENIRKQYENIAEYDRENHIFISIGGQLVRIPVGEELGQIINPVRHLVETLHDENKYQFWNLMLNDAVGFLPVDLTGFTDPEIWDNIYNTPPSFLEVMENGISQTLAQTMPPLLQSGYMAATGRDLYTGKKVNTSNISIDADGNAVISSYTQSAFAKAVANIIGGDARVIEKVTSGVVGTVGLDILDSITSAVNFVATGGKEGSFTTLIERAGANAANPYAIRDYGKLESTWSQASRELSDEKEAIENSQEYKKYNDEIRKTKDSARRQELVNKRNELLIPHQEKVARLVRGYRDAGGQLNGIKFSAAIRLVTFEDAVNADRAFMELNTDYYNARTQALQTLNNYGITNPDGISMLGYIALDDKGHEQLKLWTPAQMQIVQNQLYEQGDIHMTKLMTLVNANGDDSIKNLKKAEDAAEQQIRNKGKLSNADYDKIDDLRKEYNKQVILALDSYMNEYGAATILNNESVMDYLENVFKVPSSYEKVNNRYVSSGGGKLNKQQGFVRSYIKYIYGVK